MKVMVQTLAEHHLPTGEKSLGFTVLGRLK